MKKLKIGSDPEEMIIDQAVETLTSGGLLLFPTETTYGAGVDATNQAAVDKLLAYKSRREGKPLSIAVIDQEMAEKYVELTDSARTIYHRFLPGPVTVVSKSRGLVADGVASEFGTLGVRIPDYPLLLKIVKKLGKPITATSANGSGKKRPYSIEDIFSNLSAKQTSLVDAVIDAGTLPPNDPSTVIDTTLSTPISLRDGVLTDQLASSQKANSQTTTTLFSQSETDTQKLAVRFGLKYWDIIKEHGLVIGLDGALGVGKTIFTKGMAEFLGITDTITSPTYTYIEEYDYTRHGVSGRLYHLDVWKIDSPEQFALLEFDSLLKPHNIVLVEWWNQVTELALKAVQKQHTQLIHFHITDQPQTETSSDRTITLTEYQKL